MIRHVLAAIVVLLLAGCAAMPSSTAQVDPVAGGRAGRTEQLIIPTEAASPTPYPTATARPTATPAPSPTATPAPSPTPTPGPPRVGLQVGHWKLEELPEELAALRKASGSYYGGYDEWEINIEVARRVAQLLEAEGVIVDLLPATVPPGYQADAFISIHADGASGAQAQIRRGWKIATPWRASPASEALAEALRESYGAVAGLPPDERGPSLDMRGYYAFAWFRFHHAIAPTTPAAIIEMGFMTHPDDRVLLFEQPDIAARGIAAGILAYLATYDPYDTAARTPAFLPMLAPAQGRVALHRQPDAGSAVVLEVGPEERLLPLSEVEGWYLVTTRSEWDVGWVRKQEVVAVQEPQTPPG